MWSLLSVPGAERRNNHQGHQILSTNSLQKYMAGGALVSCSTSTPINHIVFFCRIPVVLENRRSSRGGGGGGPPPPPPPRTPAPSP